MDYAVVLYMNEEKTAMVKEWIKELAPVCGSDYCLCTEPHITISAIIADDEELVKKEAAELSKVLKKGEIKVMPSAKQIEGFARLLEEKRDIFVFQCLVGCRVGDLLKLTKGNVNESNDGVYLHYIAEKTTKTSARTINVPLHDDALAIVKKYINRDGARLLPFVSAQKYNNEIKRVFEAVGITRNVTIYNIGCSYTNPETS